MIAPGAHRRRAPPRTPLIHHRPVQRPGSKRRVARRIRRTRRGGDGSAGLGSHSAVRPGGRPREPAVRDARPPGLDRRVGIDPPRRRSWRFETSQTGCARRSCRRAARIVREPDRPRRSDLRDWRVSSGHIGAAFVIPASIALVATSYQGAVRATAIGVAYGAYGVGGAAASILLRAVPGEQWPAMLAAIGACAVALGLALTHTLELRRPTQAERPLVVEVAVSAFGIITFTVGLTWIGGGLDNPLRWAMIVGGLALVIGYQGLKGARTSRCCPDHPASRYGRAVRRCHDRRLRDGCSAQPAALLPSRPPL